MDSISFSNIKIEKAKAIKKHRQLQKLASLFRLLEVCLVLALITRFYTQIPESVKNSSGYFKGLSVILVSPHFVFVLGNVIVITLFAKSGQFSGQDQNGKSSKTDLYEEFIEKSEKNRRSEAEYGEKQSSHVECAKNESCCNKFEAKSYQRSQSENLRRPKQVKSSQELRRSMTEKCRGVVDSSDGSEKVSYPEDKMSNEEFKSKIEAFIERQKRFRRDEENSVF